MADVDTSKIDFERVHMLLNTVHLQSLVGPKLNHLGNAAMTELTDLNEKIKVAAQEAEKNAAKLKAEADAKERARVEAEANPPLNPILPRTLVVAKDEEPDARPSVYPSDSQTATIADRRV